MNKKAQKAYEGFSTVGMWALVIAIGLALIIILGLTTDFGRQALAKLTESVSFV